MSVMSATAGVAGAPFRVGSALSRSFAVFSGGVVKFVILGAIPLLPSLGDSIAISLGLASSGLSPNGGHLWRQLGFSMLAMVLYTLSTAACLSGAYHTMRGQPFSVGQSLRDGFRRFFPLVGVAIVSTLLTWLAGLALIVPGAIVACAFYVAVPVCAIEQAGVGASLRRSRDLTLRQSLGDLRAAASDLSPGRVGPRSRDNWHIAAWRSGRLAASRDREAHAVPACRLPLGCDRAHLRGRRHGSRLLRSARRQRGRRHRANRCGFRLTDDRRRRP